MRAQRVLAGVAAAGIALAMLAGCSTTATPKAAAESLLEAISAGDVEQFQALTGLPADDALVTMLPTATGRITDTSVVEVDPAADGAESHTVQIEYALAGETYADSLVVTRASDGWLVEPPTVPVVSSTGTAFTLGGALLGGDSRGEDALDEGGMALPGTYPVEMDATLVSLGVSELSVAPQPDHVPVIVPASINAEQLETAAHTAARAAIETCFDGGVTGDSMPTKCLGVFAGHDQGPIKFRTTQLQGEVPELTLAAEESDADQSDGETPLVLRLVADDTLTVQTTLKNSLYTDGKDTVTTESLSLRVEVIIDETGSAIRWISVDGLEAQ